MKTYKNIIDQTANSIRYIDGKFVSEDYPIEIAQRFGFDYVCSLNEKHKYSEKVTESVEEFKKIAKQLFDTFGTLISGIIGNIIIKNSTVDITEDNVKYISKGLITNRLLTTFKLKEYIITKLKEQRLSPSISLSEFYEVAKRKIFLNFTVIDIDKERLTFLNKNTAPNMPLWAAIIATSSLPFLHKFF